MLQEGTDGVDAPLVTPLLRVQDLIGLIGNLRWPEDGRLKFKMMTSQQLALRIRPAVGEVRVASIHILNYTHLRRLVFRITGVAQLVPVLGLAGPIS